MWQDSRRQDSRICPDWPRQHNGCSELGDVHVHLRLVRDQMLVTMLVIKKLTSIVN